MWRAIKANDVVIQLENDATGYGIGFPPANWKVIFLPNDLLPEDAKKMGLMGRAMKYPNGDYIRFYDVEEAKKCADLLAKARAADKRNSAAFNRMIKDALDEADDKEL